MPSSVISVLDRLEKSMSSASRILSCLRLGRVSYQHALDVQHACASLLISDGQRDVSHRNGILLVLEHDPVYTTGLRSDRYPSGVEQALRERGADFYRTNRGGEGEQYPG